MLSFSYELCLSIWHRIAGCVWSVMWWFWFLKTRLNFPYRSCWWLVVRRFFSIKCGEIDLIWAIVWQDHYFFFLNNPIWTEWFFILGVIFHYFDTAYFGSNISLFWHLISSVLGSIPNTRKFVKRVVGGRRWCGGNDSVRGGQWWWGEEEIRLSAGVYWWHVVSKELVNGDQVYWKIYWHLQYQINALSKHISWWI